MVDVRRATILTAGKGTRLRPLTYATTKCLLPVFDRPMVIYPLETLISLGVNEVCMVVNSKYRGEVKKVVEHYAGDKVKFTYVVQKELNGIGAAVSLTEGFFGDKKVAVIFGDNIFGHVRAPESVFEDDYAYVFVMESDTPSAFGVIEFDEKGHVIGIEEKPEHPKSKTIVTGLAIYPNDVFQYIKQLKPHKNGETYISEVNNFYIKQGRLRLVNVEGGWTDTGTVETYLRASLKRAKELGRI